MAQRAVVSLAPPGQESELAEKLAGGRGIRPISIAELRALVPALKARLCPSGGDRGRCVRHGRGRLAPGFPAPVASGRRRAGAAQPHRADRAPRRGVGCRSERRRQVPRDGPGRTPPAPGATRWRGRRASRRSAWCRSGAPPWSIDPQPWKPADWPMLDDVSHSWYCRPEARTKLMVSPADETDMHPHDVQPDELDVAIAVDRMQQALDIDGAPGRARWAGLRTFSAGSQPGIGLGRNGGGVFLERGAGRLRHPDLAGGGQAGGRPGLRDATRAKPRRLSPAIDPRRFARP